MRKISGFRTPAFVAAGLVLSWVVYIGYAAWRAVDADDVTQTKGA